MRLFSSASVRRRETMSAQNLLIGPVGLAIAVITVVAFVAAMLLPSLASIVEVPTETSATDVALEPHRGLTGRSGLRAFASMRWPLVVLTILITTYRIYSLS